MHYEIDYQIHFEFGESISEQQVELRLLPRQDKHQKLLSFDLAFEPNTSVFEFTDAYGNRTQALSILSPHSFLKIRLKAEVENILENPFDYILPISPSEEKIYIQKKVKEEPKLFDFLLPSGPSVPALNELSFNLKFPQYDPEQHLQHSIQQALQWIESEFKYLPGSTDVHSPLQEVLDKRAGVCQDFSHLLCAIVRDWGFLARYVMGYQHLESPLEENPATHAWTEIFIPGIGWMGFDATHRLLTNHYYIPVAVGRHSQDAAPERGNFLGKTRGLKPKIQLVMNPQQ